MYWLLGIILFIFLLIYVICEYFFKKTFGRMEKSDLERTLADFDENFKKSHLALHYPKILNGRAFIANTPYEDKFIISFDGLKLYARHYRAKNKKATVILCHGYKSHGTHDFSMIVEIYLKKNFDVLLISQRAQVESEGKYITFGQMERYDIRDWCKTIDGKILIHGLSMGATSVLLAAELPEVNERILGVVADCGFDNAKEQFIHVAKNMMKIPPHPAVDIITYMAKKRFGLDPSLYVSKNLDKITVPVLLIHGMKDEFVPFENTKRIYQLHNGKKMIFTSKEAGHAMSYLEDMNGCSALLDEFINSLTI